MIIEKLNRNDLLSYKELIDKAFGSSQGITEYEKYDENAHYQIVVAKDKDKIIGSVTFYKINLFTFGFQPALEIFNVAVLKEYQGQKIATKLFDYIIDYAKQNNYKSIYLTCLDTAVPAHKLYESLGMKRMSSIKYSMTL